MLVVQETVIVMPIVSATFDVHRYLHLAMIIFPAVFMAQQTVMAAPIFVSDKVD